MVPLKLEEVHVRCRAQGWHPALAHRAGTQRWRGSVIAATHGRVPPNAGGGRADPWTALGALPRLFTCCVVPSPWAGAGPGESGTAGVT